MARKRNADGRSVGTCKPVYRWLGGVVLTVGSLVLVAGCPPRPPGCAEESETCDGSADCCSGLSCVDGVCAPSEAECAEANDACDETAECCEGLICAASVCVSPGAGNTAALPAKHIEFDLIGIHDPSSDSYDGDCIGCHGDRTNEVALDGVTPSVHSTMLSLFGEGNDRCIQCHESAPNFLTYSGVDLRRQVDMEQVACDACHGSQATFAFYVE